MAPAHGCPAPADSADAEVHKNSSQTLHQSTSFSSTAPGLTSANAWRKVPSSSLRLRKALAFLGASPASGEEAVEITLGSHEEELLRKRFWLAQVQPLQLCHCPLLLCRLAEEDGIAAPDPKLLLNQDDGIKGTEALRSALDQLLQELSEAPTAHAPEPIKPGRLGAAKEALPVPSRFAKACDIVPGRDDRKVARAARTRRFSKPWWTDWLEAIAEQRLSSRNQSYCDAQYCVAEPDGLVNNPDALQSLLDTARRRIVQDAPPEELRLALWLWLAPHGEVDQLRPAWYRQLQACSPGSELGREAEQQLRRLIWKDLERTSPSLFVRQGLRIAADSGRNASLYSARSAAAERLLIAYSRHRPSVGYCQGLNFVAATLLQLLDEQSAFVVFCGLLERLPRDLYSCDPERLAECRIAQQEGVRRLLRAERPKLFAHMDTVELDLNLFLPRWLTCLFASVLPTPATLRLWDFVLGADGGTALPRLALAILARAEDAFLAAAEISEALAVLTTAVNGLGPEDVDVMLKEEWTLSRFERSWPIAEAEDENDDYEGSFYSLSMDVSTVASTFNSPDEV
eukprot:TRINITY_DN3052_c0_g3_i1.p1 TRINITY_DN3052_c0_g3~~TRINITY_DN3052_c0_g3_i1.p1  ORF type:complete len:610 (-),score=105.80 TRINITY_DN3052_c0_g3_i1:214-1926(-)